MVSGEPIPICDVLDWNSINVCDGPLRFGACKLFAIFIYLAFYVVQWDGTRSTGLTYDVLCKSSRDTYFFIIVVKSHYLAFSSIVNETFKIRTNERELPDLYVTPKGCAIFAKSMDINKFPDISCACSNRGRSAGSRGRKPRSIDSSPFINPPQHYNERH